ncbi:putative amidohydrolase YtcJ [Bacilli bacterium PM5-3]|nr:putative amidohydrolase YtcJ [Bacilli bacterium PM5-3]MDH6603779.1 putative amidohydrolase YtcJ [Bacilli bacterium PM5-9]
MKNAYINGIIHTMNDHRVVEAMLVDDEKIKNIGTTKEILELVDDNTQVIDLEQKVVIPGFIDSHLHGLLSSQKMSQVDLSQAKSIDDLVNITKDTMPKNLKDGDWVIGRGWNQDYFDIKKFPTKDDLDRISTDVPICLIRACIHICVVNSKALEIINLDKNNLPQLSDGEIYTDENGDLNGLFSETALTYVYSNFPKLALNDIKELILNFNKHLNSEGITSIQTDDFTALPGVEYHEVMQAYQELAKDKKLTVKVYQQCLLPKVNLLKDFLAKGYRTKQDFGFYRIGPLKLLLDGSLGARTAVIEGGYADAPEEKGISTYDDNELYELGKIAQENDLQMAIHGIGDGATNQIMRLYSRLNKEMPKDNSRHGIVHCQITETPALEQIAKEKVVVYAQPIFLHYDIHIVDSRVGAKKGKTSYAFKTLMDKGVSVSMGTDSPVEPTNPFNNIYCAITRKDLNNTFDKGWNEHECLSVYEAIRAYTYEGAYQSFEEDYKGTLEVGKVADFAVLNQDIFSVDVEDIPKTQVLKTVVNGKLVYTK